MRDLLSGLLLSLLLLGGGVSTAAGASPVTLLTSSPISASSPATGLSSVPAGVATSRCGWEKAETTAPTYYAVELISTKRIAGTRASKGIAELAFARSPFGIAVSEGGDYLYDLDISVEGLSRSDAVYAVWVTTPSLDQIKRIGILDPQGRARGRVAWNKFLVVISLESSTEEMGDTWKGPIILRGMSRSGMMHTMAGHGPFQLEPCAKYGY